NNIIKWKIIDLYTSQLDIIVDSYEQVLRNLSIEPSNEVVEDVCMICLENHSNILKLPCGHYYCLESLLRFYELNKIKNVCMYCKKTYHFSQCTSCLSNVS